MEFFGVSFVYMKTIASMAAEIKELKEKLEIVQTKAHTDGYQEGYADGLFGKSNKKDYIK